MVDLERWDRLAVQYAEWVERNEDEAGHVFAAAVRRAVVSRLPSGRDRKALDLGCGTGALLEALGQRYECVVGLDGSLGMIRVARSSQRGAAGRTLVADTTVSLPFDAAAFDVVVASMVFMCVENLGGVLQEVARTLRPGGELVFTVTHPCFSYLRRNRLESGQPRYLDCFASEHRLGPTFPTAVRHYHRPVQVYFETLRRNALAVRSMVEISPEELPEDMQLERLLPYYMTANAMLFHAVRV